MIVAACVLFSDDLLHPARSHNVVGAKPATLQDGTMIPRTVLLQLGQTSAPVGAMYSVGSGDSGSPGAPLVGRPFFELNAIWVEVKVPEGDGTYQVLVHSLDV